tara:strand:+ start:100 stop:324 length:225 start_codon:yes stop_codon:yes gene_type:complete
MTDKPENPPAFPHTDWIHPDTGQGQTYEGMKLRDWFASLALLGMTSYSPISHPDTAQDAYLYADAMLKARNNDK